MLTNLAAVATIASLVLAGWQYRRHRRTVEAEAERVDAQQQRLTNAHAAALSTRDAADAIVQRSKVKGVTVAELGQHARAIRAQLRVLEKQLAAEDELLRGWRPEGRTFASESPDMSSAATRPRAGAS
jgi:hypothetical protein